MRQGQNPVANFLNSKKRVSITKFVVGIKICARTAGNMEKDKSVFTTYWHYCFNPSAHGTCSINNLLANFLSPKERNTLQGFANDVT